MSLVDFAISLSSTNVPLVRRINVNVNYNLVVIQVVDSANVFVVIFYREATNDGMAIVCRTLAGNGIRSAMRRLSSLQIHVV